MKLIEISHLRCDDVEGSLLMWAPDEVDETRLRADAAAAQADYLAAGRAATTALQSRQASLVAPILNARGELVLDSTVADELTVGELRAAAAGRAAVMAEAGAVLARARRPFSAFFRERGYVALEDAPGALSVVLDWSHRHGDDLELTERPARADPQGLLRTRKVPRPGPGVVVIEDYVAEDPGRPDVQ